jgi:mono/diheme cytochrome c family protein
MTVIKITALLIFATIFIAACGQSGSNTNSGVVTNSVPAGKPDTTPIVADADPGKEVYAMNCMICHKEDGSGGKRTVDGKPINAEDLRKEKFKVATDEKLASYVRDGIPDEGMPAFKGKLTEAEILNVVKHVRSLQK